MGILLKRERISLQTRERIVLGGSTAVCGLAMAMVIMHRPAAQPTPTFSMQAWNLQVMGATRQALTKTTVEPLVGLGRGKGPIRGIDAVVPKNAAFVPALDELGMELPASAPVRYRLSSNKVFTFNPKIVHTSIDPTLSENLLRVLPHGSGAIVVSNHGHVLALLGSGLAWKAPVNAGPALFLPMLGALISKNPMATAFHPSKRRLALAWRALGLDRAVLPLMKKPQTAGRAVAGPSLGGQVKAPLASIAEAYLPLLDQGQTYPLTLVGALSTSRQVTNLSAVKDLSRALPRETIHGIHVTIWRPLGQSLVVAWATRPRSWLVVVNAPGTSRIAPIVSSILASE